MGAAGASGTPMVTKPERAESRLQPTEFFAATLNVYDLPLVRPKITSDVAVELNTLVGKGELSRKGITSY